MASVRNHLYNKEIVKAMLNNSDSDVEQVHAPSKKRTPRKNDVVTPRKGTKVVAESGSDDEVMVPVKKGGSRKVVPKPDSESESEEDEVVVTPRKGGRVTPSKRTPRKVVPKQDSESESEEDEVVVTPRKGGKRTKVVPEPEPESEDDVVTPRKVASESEEDEVVVTPSKGGRVTVKSRRVPLNKNNAPPGESDEQSENEVKVSSKRGPRTKPDSESEEEEGVIVAGSRKHVVVNDNDDDDDDKPVKQTRRNGKSKEETSQRKVINTDKKAVKTARVNTTKATIKSVFEKSEEAVSDIESVVKKNIDRYLNIKGEAEKVFATVSDTLKKKND